MLLSVTVLLLSLSFLVRVATDLLRDREATVLVTRYIEQERIKAAEKASRAVDDEISEAEQEQRDGPSEPDPWWEDYYKVKEQSEKAVLKAEEKVGMRRLPQRVRLLRKYLEIGVPALFAVNALALTGAQLAAFMSALLSTLWGSFSTSAASS